MSELRRQRWLEDEFLVVWESLFDYLLLVGGILLVVGRLLGLYKSRIQLMENQNIHIFNIIDDQWLLHLLKVVLVHL